MPPALCRLLVLVCACTALLLALPALASADVLYGATGGGSGGGGDPASNTGTLFTINPATGAATAIGAIGDGVTGLAVDPTTGVLYGSTTSKSATNPNSIITIDPATGAGTFVGLTNDGSGVADIAFDASGQLWGWSEDGDDLVTIDKTTGAATHIGDGPSSAGDGMSFAPDGTLYGMFDGDGGTIDVVDTSTGDVTTGPGLTGSPYGGNRTIPAASFSCDGTTLYALDGLAGFGDPPVANLVTVDISTGAITDIGQTTDRMDGLAWSCGVLYGSTSGSAETLYTLDRFTGAATAIGPIGFDVTGLAVDPTTGTLYGSTSSKSLNDPRSIITIDRTTGAGTLVGPVGNADRAVADIAFDSAGRLWGWSEQADNFVSIDKATGAATVIGPSQNSRGDGMSFAFDGTLYGMFDNDNGDLDVVNTTTGVRTPVATLSGGPYVGRPIPAAAFDCTGSTLFALNGLSVVDSTVHLVTVDTSTGAITDVGATTDIMDGLEFDCFGVPGRFAPSGGGGGHPGGEPPLVTSLFPTSGPAGTVVGITGDRFEQATQVLFGTTPASFDIDGFMHITAIAPPGSGTVDVRVVDQNGTSAIVPGDQFTYTSPPAAPPGGVPAAAGPTCPKVSQLRRRTIRGARKYMDRDGCNVPLRVGRRVPLKEGFRRRVVSQTPAAGTATSGPVTINMGYLPKK